MVAILADNIFKCFFLNENDRIRIQISLKFVPRGSTDSKSALVQVMALRQTAAISWTNDDPVHWHIYAALVGDEWTVLFFFLRYIQITILSIQYRISK